MYIVYYIEYNASFTAGPNVIYRAHEEFGDRRDHVTSARTYFYEDEAMCDENMRHFLRGIDAVSGKQPSYEVTS